ncbi:MAG TPA: hypothetical protein VJ952_08635, partial [Opitutales bacterium]|nr:hypothetical protein [Opitutales bacterium]
MTSADEFVLQLLTDKGIVDSAAIEDARAKISESSDDGDEDTAILEHLIAEHKLMPMQVAEVL